MLSPVFHKNSPMCQQLHFLNYIFRSIVSVIFTSSNNDTGYNNRGTGFYIRYRAVKGIKMFFFIKVKKLLTRVVNVINFLKQKINIYLMIELK